MENTNRPQLEALLDLESPLVAVEGFSSVSTENLNAIEAALEVQTTNAENVQALTDAQNAQSAAEGITSEVQSSLNTLLSENGLTADPEATSAERFALLQSHIADLGSRDASASTIVTADPKQPKETNSIIDASASHNLLADQLNN